MSFPLFFLPLSKPHQSSVSGSYDKWTGSVVSPASTRSICYLSRKCHFRRDLAQVKVIRLGHSALHVYSRKGRCYRGYIWYNLVASQVPFILADCATSCQPHTERFLRVRTTNELSCDWRSPLYCEQRWMRNSDVERSRN